MVDWKANERLLIDASECALRAFLSEHPITTICAVGYVFELGNTSEQFDLCINTHDYFQASVETYHKAAPNIAADEIRWNSGDFEFPAGLPGESYRDAWRLWTVESARLNQLAKQDPDSRKVYNGLIAISCTALATLTKRGLFGDWSKIDFNVSDMDDDVHTVKLRDRQIRDLIERDA